MIWGRRVTQDPTVSDEAQCDAIHARSGKLMIGLTSSDTGQNCWITSKPSEGEQAKAEWKSERQVAPIKSVELKWKDAAGCEGELKAKVNKTKRWNIKWTRCDGTTQEAKDVVATHIPLGEDVAVTAVTMKRAPAKARGIVAEDD